MRRANKAKKHLNFISEGLVHIFIEGSNVVSPTTCVYLTYLEDFI